MNKKILFYMFFIIILSIIFTIVFSSFSYAAYPKLVSKLIKGFESVKDWLIKIATPAAAVAVRYRCFYEKI